MSHNYQTTSTEPEPNSANKLQYINSVLPRLGNLETTPYKHIVVEAMSFVRAESAPDVPERKIFIRAMQGIAITAVEVNTAGHVAQGFVPAAMQLITYACTMEHPSVAALSERRYPTIESELDGRMELQLSAAQITDILFETLQGMYLLNQERAAGFN